MVEQQGKVNPEVDGIVVLTTGGTIDKVYFDAKSQFEVGDSVLKNCCVKLMWTAAINSPRSCVKTAWI